MSLNRQFVPASCTRLVWGGARRHVLVQPIAPRLGRDQHLSRGELEKQQARHKPKGDDLMTRSQHSGRQGPRLGLIRPSKTDWALAVLLPLGLGSGCSRGPELEPAKAANESVPGSAQTSAANVRVQANADGWTGDPEVTEFVTPVYLAVENGGDAPLRVRYSDIALVSGDGERFRALPPFDVHGTVEKRARLVPRFGHRGAALAPYLGFVYDEADVELEPPSAYPNLQYYDHLYDHWRARIPLPTQYMQEVAFPEALVRPRGEISGYVYFERVPPSKERVTLQIDLIDATTNGAVATATIPFVVHE